MPLKDLDDLAYVLRARAKHVSKLGPELVKQAVYTIGKELIETTPVRHGRAVSNWQFTIGHPAADYKYAGCNDEPGVSQGIQEAWDSLMAALDEYQGGRASIVISNNAPYIKRLNDGWSEQAPAGFIEAAIDAGVQAVRALPGNKAVVFEVADFGSWSAY